MVTGLLRAAPILERFFANWSAPLRRSTRATDTTALGSTGESYRWRDTNGTLHIESMLPSGDVSFETIELTKTTHPSSSTGQIDRATTSGSTPERGALVNPLDV